MKCQNPCCDNETRHVSGYCLGCRRELAECPCDCNAPFCNHSLCSIMFEGMEPNQDLIGFTPIPMGFNFAATMNDAVYQGMSVRDDI